LKGFRDPQEFRDVFEHVFVLMNEHPEVGRLLRDAHAPHRFVFTDLGLELNVAAAPDSEERNGRYLGVGTRALDTDHHPHHVQRDRHRFFQGRRTWPWRSRSTGEGPRSDPTILRLAPVTGAIHPVYRRWLEQTGRKHLLA
jgi:hypothetical protein